MLVATEHLLAHCKADVKVATSEGICIGCFPICKKKNKKNTNLNCSSWVPLLVAAGRVWKHRVGALQSKFRSLELVT